MTDALTEGLFGVYQPRFRWFIVWADVLIVALGGFLGVATAWRYAHGGSVFWFGLLEALVSIKVALRLIRPARTVVEPTGLRVRRDLRWREIGWADVLSVDPPGNWDRGTVQPVLTARGVVELPGFPCSRGAELMAHARAYATSSR